MNDPTEKAFGVLMTMALLLFGSVAYLNNAHAQKEDGIDRSSNILFPYVCIAGGVYGTYKALKE